MSSEPGRKSSKKWSAATIVLWVFVIVEAIGIGYFLATYSSRPTP